MTTSPTDSDPHAGTLECDPEESAANVVSLHAGRRYGSRPARAGNDKLSGAQRAWLARGLDQPGGKLPLFDRDGKRVSDRTVKSCIRQGWAKPWFDNPIKPDWLVCKLTDEGRRIFIPRG
jgi:hypothetical protein